MLENRPATILPLLALAFSRSFLKSRRCGPARMFGIVFPAVSFITESWGSMHAQGRGVTAAVSGVAESWACASPSPSCPWPVNPCPLAGEPVSVRGGVPSGVVSRGRVGGCRESPPLTIVPMHPGGAIGRISCSRGFFNTKTRFYSSFSPILQQSPPM